VSTKAVERCELVVHGRSLEVARITTSSALKPIVLLHEGLGSIALWRDFPEQLSLATGRDVIVYSRYGHGGSERLTAPRTISYMHDEARIVLPELLRALGVSSPVLFGHSDGASIALIYAAAAAQNVTALVLEAPHVFVEPITLESIAQMRVSAAQGDVLEKLARYHDDPRGVFYGWNDIWLHPDFRSWDIRDVLPAIRAPMLVLQGHDDEYGTAAQIAAIRAVLPDTQASFFEDCGHSPHRSQTRLVLERACAFLATQP
jgi:pimeloyl-ACP methyl ester carboxylesterase